MLGMSNSSSKSLVHDILEYAPSTVIPALVALIFLPIVTRLFNPDVYGNYALVMTTVTILTTLAGWVNMSVIRFYHSYEKQGLTQEFVSLSVTLFAITVLLILFFVILILNVVKHGIGDSLYTLMIVGLFVFVLNSLFTLLLDFLRIKRSVTFYSIFFVWKSVATLAFGLLFIYKFHADVKALLWGAIFSMGLAVPLLWKMAIGAIMSINVSKYKEYSFEMIRYSFPLVIGNLAAWVLSLSDRYILQFFRGSHEVGIYAISYQISDQSIMLFITLFAQAFNPLSIIVWENGGHKKSQEFLTQGTRYFLILCLPAVMAISVMRDVIIRMLTTHEYYQGANIIPYVVFGVFLLGLNQRFGAGLSFYKKTKYFMASLIIAGTANLALNYLFVPRYGYMAAAIITLGSYALLLMLNIIISRRFFTWPFPFKTLINSVIASLVMSIGIGLISRLLIENQLLNLIVTFFISNVIYFFLLFVMREFTDHELAFVKKLVTKILSRCKIKCA